MSRIHEALKKAEQERAASQGTVLESTPVGEMSLGREEAAPPTAVPSAPQFNYEALLARYLEAAWNPDPGSMLFFSGEEHAPGMEEFRTLRSRLYKLREKMPLKKLLVSSSLPKEGKSFVAANLAQVMVKQHGRRVLLLDADMRGPRLHEYLGTVGTPGLSDYLLGQKDEIAVIQRGPMQNLFFIPAGTKVSSPAELVANGRLKLLLSRLEPLFDWIIMDSPPAVPVSDPSLLANFCDGVLMVVRSNLTPFDIARKARLEFAEKQLVGVVLNGIDANTLPYSHYQYEYQADQGNGRGRAKR